MTSRPRGFEVLGPDLLQDFVAPVRPCEQLELAPVPPAPLVVGEPAAQLRLEPRRVSRFALGLELVLRASLAQHFQVKSGHRSTVTPDARKGHYRIPMAGSA